MHKPTEGNTMKKILATAMALSMSTMSVYAEEVIAIAEEVSVEVAAEEVMAISASAPRVLAYESYCDMHFDEENVYSITTQTHEGTVTCYTITENTLFIDAMTGERTSYKDIVGFDENFYIYANPEKAESDPLKGVAQAIIMNIPMDAMIPKLYVVEHVAAEDEVVTLLLDTEGISLSIPADFPVTTYEDGALMTVAEITANARIFIWESVMPTPNNEPYQIVMAESVAVEIPVDDVIEEEPVKVELPAISTTVEVTMYDGLAYIPLRATANALGLVVDWSVKEHQATLSSELRQMTIAPLQTVFTSAPKDAGLLGMPTPQTLNKAFIDSAQTMQVDPQVFAVLMGFDIVQNGNTVVISSN